jgi:hypothetical protein
MEMGGQMGGQMGGHFYKKICSIINGKRHKSTFKHIKMPNR